MSEFVTRFAPSPTGYLHLGHACSAFHVWDAARAANGRVLLRIEDIDQTISPMSRYSSPDCSLMKTSRETMKSHQLNSISLGQSDTEN